MSLGKKKEKRKKTKIEIKKKIAESGFRSMVINERPKRTHTHIKTRGQCKFVRRFISLLCLCVSFGKRSQLKKIERFSTTSRSLIVSAEVTVGSHKSART